MPDGVIKWYDPKTGEAAVVRHGRTFPTHRGDIEAVARHAGARVHFDIHRARGVEGAVGVRLREGTRVSHRQHRFGTLAGAWQLDDKGVLPYAHVHPELHAGAVHPLEVARAWATSIARGDVTGALSLYAPDAVVQVDGREITGRAALGAWLETIPPFDTACHARVQGADDGILVSWAVAGPDQSATKVHCEINHAQITRQRMREPEAQRLGEEEAAPPLLVELSTHGAVSEDVRTGAEEVVRAIAGRLAEPVLFARVKLTQEADPARVRPAIAEAALDVDGEVVRAHVAAGTMPEALDRLGHRLADRLEHRAQHREELHRFGAHPTVGEWRHGDIPTERPPYFDRPPEERDLVRHKMFAMEELTPDEAVFDMDQLDYDFYLFRDLASGEESLVSRADDGSYQMTVLTPADVDLGPTAAPIKLSNTHVPKLVLSEAVERLNAGNEPYVFFVNGESGRGNVLYRRYDGHYGLITPD
jgi:hypothetical protein